MDWVTVVAIVAQAVLAWTLIVFMVQVRRAAPTRAGLRLSIIFGLWAVGVVFNLLNIGARMWIPGLTNVVRVLSAGWGFVIAGSVWVGLWRIK